MSVTKVPARQGRHLIDLTRYPRKAVSARRSIAARHLLDAARPAVATQLRRRCHTAQPEHQPKRHKNRLHFMYLHFMFKTQIICARKRGGRSSGTAISPSKCSAWPANQTACGDVAKTGATQTATDVAVQNAAQAPRAGCGIRSAQSAPSADALQQAAPEHPTAPAGSAKPITATIKTARINRNRITAFIFILTGYPKTHAGAKSQRRQSGARAPPTPTKVDRPQPAPHTAP